MKLIVDSREQTPFSFADYDCEVVPGTLTTGDYGIEGLAHLASVERKSLPDLIGSISQGRERFEKELARARGLRSFLVVVESPFSDLAGGNYRSRMKPEAAVQTVYSYMARYRTPFRFCASRAGAEFATYHFLRHFQNQVAREYKAAIAA